MTDSDRVDLYEEMLYERAARNIRPVLYISSPTDFDCSLLLLLDEAEKEQLGGQLYLSAE